ncbi:unnamed protein product [Fusarium fujikuroi]|nr:unnamed protein product [Fusarium fujikuroi]
MSTSQSSRSSTSTSLDTTEAPIVTRRKEPQRIYRPETNSLYDIFQQYAGTPLFLRLIYWSDLHAQLLGARWEELPSCKTPLPSADPGTAPSQGHLSPSNTIIRLSNALTQILLPDPLHFILSSDAVKSVLETLWPTPFNKTQDQPKIHLYFGGFVYHDAVHAQLMWNYPSEDAKSSKSSFESLSTETAESSNISKQSSPKYSPANLPMICYIGKTQLASIRNDLFAPLLDLDEQITNPWLASRSCGLKYFYPAPSDENKAKHRSRISSLQGIPPSPNFHDMKLKIMTHDIDTSEFIVYTGYITKEFLEKFHNPFKAPANDDDAMVSGLKIEYTRVPIWPILGLRERLGKALGQEIVGTFDPDKMETWEEDPEKPRSEKRERASSLSPSEDTEEEPEIISKKRCLSEGTPVGVRM